MCSGDRVRWDTGEQEEHSGKEYKDFWGAENLLALTLPCKLLVLPHFHNHQTLQMRNYVETQYIRCKKNHIPCWHWSRTSPRHPSPTPTVGSSMGISWGFLRSSLQSRGRASDDAMLCLEKAAEVWAPWDHGEICSGTSRDTCVSVDPSRAETQETLERKTWQQWVTADRSMGADRSRRCWTLPNFELENFTGDHQRMSDFFFLLCFCEECWVTL